MKRLLASRSTINIRCNNISSTEFDVAVLCYGSSLYTYGWTYAS